VDLAHYRVFATHDLAFVDGAVRLHVIGASSLVLVQLPGLALAEVIACTDGVPPSPALARGVISLSSGSNAALSASDQRFSYQARLWAVPIDGEEPAGRWEHLLEHRFPGPGAPLTRIEAATTGGGLRLRTRHDYPEAGVTVWSESDWHFTRP